MRVTSDLIDCMHLDPGYALLSVQNIITCMELFRMMDVHHNTTLNDVQFWVFIKSFTDLTRYDADLLFHLLDVDHSGEMDFEEFYLIFCVLIASKDQYEKEFIYRHSGSIFRLIDSDASGLVSNDEFSQMGILFNFDTYSISSIFEEFDISGDKNLDFGEFRLFTMACIDEQRAVDVHSKVTAFQNYHQRLLVSLQDVLKHYIKTRILPKPSEIEFLIDRVRPPFIPKVRRWRNFFDAQYFVFLWLLIFNSIVFCVRKCISYVKLLFHLGKKLLLKWKCDVFCKKYCHCFHVRTRHFGFRTRSDWDSYRNYNRRKRHLARIRKFLRKNKDYDLGQEGTLLGIQEEDYDQIEEIDSAGEEEQGLAVGDDDKKEPAELETLYVKGQPKKSTAEGTRKSKDSQRQSLENATPEVTGVQKL